MREWMGGVVAVVLAGVAHAGPAPAEAVSARVAGDVVVEQTDVRTWVAGSFHRFTPSIHGIPLEGADLVASVDAEGNVRRVHGASVPDLAVDPVPSVEADDAIGLAASWAGRWLGHGQLWSPRAELRVWLDPAHPAAGAHLAWAVDLGVADPGGTWRVLVDAHDGDILTFSATSYRASGNVYPTNPDTSDLTTVELEGLTSDVTLSGTYAEVVSCDTWQTGGLGGGSCDAKSAHAIPDANGDYLFEPDPGSMDDPLAEVQMYYHLDFAGRWFEDRFDFAHPAPIEGIVNFSMQNAFYGDADGDGVGEVAFGQYLATDFAYDADVIYHEYMHSVFGQVTTAGFFGADAYGIDFSPGALNEGSADVFAVLITGDPALGEYAAPGADPIRDLEADRRCPHDLYGESHEDGLIWGSLGWNLVDDPNIGAEVSAQLFYGAISAFPSNLTWGSAGETLVQTADDMLSAGAIDATTRDAVQVHIDASGVEGCRRVIPLDDGDAARQFLLFAGLVEVAGFEVVPASAQFSLTAPENASELHFRIDDFRLAQGDGLGWRLYVRQGEFVRHDIENAMGFAVPVPADFDVAIDGEGGDYELVLTADSELALEPGQTYYFAIAARNAGGIGMGDFVFADATVSGEVVVDEAEEPDTDTTDDGLVDDDEDVAAGCGCTSSGSAGWVGWLALLVIPFSRSRRGTAARGGTR